MLKNKVLKFIMPAICGLIAIRPPRMLAVEATNRCFLECLTCPIPKHMKREKGDMSYDTFISLLDGIDWHLNRISWTFGGEPLLNKDIWRMVKLACERGIVSKIDTNGMLIGKFDNEILESGLNTLNIAFEGLTGESTSSFRIGYDYQLVMDNIKKLCDKKNKSGARYPIISLNYLVKKDNEHEIAATLEFARKLKINVVVLKSLNITPSFWLDEKKVQCLGDQFLPRDRSDLSRYERKDGRWVPRINLSDFCRYLLDSVTITWDGKVLPCCLDFDASMIAGDIHKQDLKSIWTGKAFRDIRRKVYGGKVKICNNCTSVALQERIVLNP